MTEWLEMKQGRSSSSYNCCQNSSSSLWKWIQKKWQINNKANATYSADLRPILDICLAIEQIRSINMVVSCKNVSNILLTGSNNQFRNFES